MTTADLVPCPPMKARLHVEECKRLHDSGEQPSCQGCPLGPQRGAKKKWQRTGQVDLSFWKTKGRHPRKRFKPITLGPNANSIPQWIRQCRMRLGMSQAELAVALGKGPSTVSMWEIGAHLPRPKDREALAKLVADNGQ